MTLRERLAHDDELELLAHHFDHPLVAMTISAQAAVAELERLFALPDTRESTTHSGRKRFG